MLALGLGRGISLTALTTFFLLFSPLLMETAFAQPQPSPGWYKNSGSSPICADCIGLTLQLFWENSYIYQHPGTDNLYWYAELRYLNTGNQTVSLNCGGRVDPSLAKEHIRGTEGIPPDGDGYVAAEETFCSRNPNFTFTIEPGGTHYAWAIFHNVPPGGEVSLEWGKYGSSAWVKPWASPFSAPPPVECPFELETLGTCVPVLRLPVGKATNLVVLVHGCCTDENDVKEWDGLGGEIGKKIIEAKTSAKWEVVVWDWSFNTKFCLNVSPECAKDAYDFAPGVGSNLKDAIVDAINASFGNSYEYIHLIGHSTGAKLIHEASIKLAADKTIQKRPFIHLTFLDAFTLDNDDTNSYGSSADYAEHYVDRTSPSPIALWTNSLLGRAYNFDITDWKPVSTQNPDEKKDYGHQWPRYWYEKSVTTSGFAYGYPLFTTRHWC